MWELFVLAFFLFFPKPIYRGGGVMLFRNRGQEVLLVDHGGENWGFPMNKTGEWDSSFEETATRSLYSITQLEAGKHYSLCNHREIRLGRHAYYTGHLVRGVELAPNPRLKWVFPRDLWHEKLAHDTTLWKGEMTCYSL